MKSPALRILLAFVLLVAVLPSTGHTGWTAQAQDSLTIGYGETVEGTVTDASGDRWLFEGQNGEVVTISVHSAEFQAVLLLFDSEDNLLTFASADDEGTALIEDNELDQDGLFTISVRSLGGGTGSYTLTLEALGFDFGEMVLPDQDPGPSDPVAVVENMACTATDTYFILTFPQMEGAFRSYETTYGAIAWPVVTIEATGPGARIATIMPVPERRTAEEVAAQVVMEIVLFAAGEVFKPISLAATGADIARDIHEAMVTNDQLDLTGAYIAPINTAPLRLLVWGTHDEGEGLRLTMGWAEQDEDGGPPSGDSLYSVNHGFG